MNKKGLIWYFFAGISAFLISFMLAVPFFDNGSALGVLITLVGFGLMLFLWIKAIIGLFKRRKEKDLLSEEKGKRGKGKQIIKGIGVVFALFVAIIVEILIVADKDIATYEQTEKVETSATEVEAEESKETWAEKQQRKKEEKQKAKEEKKKAEEEQRKAKEEKKKAEEEQRKAEEEKKKAEEEQRKAEEEKKKAEEEQRKAEEEKQKAEEEQRKAEEEKQKAETYVSTEPLPDDIKPIDSSMIIALMELGFTNEEASDLQEKLNSVGVNQISDVKKGAGEGIDVLQCFVAYANNDKNLKFFFTVEERKLYYAGFYDSDLYDSTKGGALKLITDVHVPERYISTEMKVQLNELAQKAVKKNLNYPSTADFRLLYWVYTREDDNYLVSGRVYAKNGFGVKSELEFEVYITVKDSMAKVTGMYMQEVQ